MIEFIRFLYSSILERQNGYYKRISIDEFICALKFDELIIRKYLKIRKIINRNFLIQFEFYLEI